MSVRHAFLVATSAVLLSLSTIGAAIPATVSATVTTASDTDTGPAIAERLNSWRPSGSETWATTENRDLTEEERQPCTGGHVTRWQSPENYVAGLIWAECASAADAANLLRRTWAGNGMYQSPALPPVFGLGMDLASPSLQGTGVDRLWTQGSLYVGLGRFCDSVAACADLTASDAQEIAALVALPVNVLPEITRPPDDILAAWNPPDENGWMLTGISGLAEQDAKRCPEGLQTTWAGADGSQTAVFWMRCPSTTVAFQLRNEKWTGWASAANTARMSYAFGAGLDVVSTFTNAWGAQGVARSWVQGRHYMNVQRTCPAGDLTTCADLSAQYARGIAELVPGRIRPDTLASQALYETGALLLGIPILTFLALLVPRRLIHWRRTRGYSTAADPAIFTPVDRMVRRVLTGRIIRRVVLTVSVVLTYYYGLVAMQQAGMWMLVFALFAPFLLYGVFGFALQLAWRPHQLIRMGRSASGGLTVGSAGGAALRGAALAGATLALALYGLATLQLITDRNSTRATADEWIAAGLQSGNLLTTLYAQFRWVVQTLDRSGMFAIAFLAMLVAVSIAYVIDRLGRRLARISLQATLQNDTRPYFLYLRGFDEDALRVDTSLVRRGFLHLFTPLGRPRFEEVLVQYLSLYGPVIAISPRRNRLADLGAAKISLSDDSWQDQVREWVQDARAVVMAGTPSEVRPGLEWEMEYIATRVDRPPVMLVLAPWPRDDVARRWQGFLDRAQRWELFAPLAEHPMPSGLHIAVWTPGAGWHGYGAKRRWDWSYAASIVTALQSEPAESARPATSRHRQQVGTRVDA